MVNELGRDQNTILGQHAKVEKKERKFSIRKTLPFKLNGKDVEIKYKINEKGFEILQSIEGTTIETSELSEPTNGSVPLTGFNVSNEIPYDVQGLSNGESVVMYKIPDEKMIKVQYIYTNSEQFYGIRTYSIVGNGPIVDYAKVVKKEKTFLIQKTLAFKQNGKDVEIKYEISEKGFKLLQGIEGTAIETLEPSQETNGSAHLTGFQLSYENNYDNSDIRHGQFFFQNLFKTNSVYGGYTFFDQCLDYFTIKYEIEDAFDDNCRINVESYVKDFEANPESSTPPHDESEFLTNKKPLPVGPPRIGR
ncbi:unnamed protein product [Diamesa serratosioi]